jgi:hypothetical protein
MLFGLFSIKKIEIEYRQYGGRIAVGQPRSCPHTKAGFVWIIPHHFAPSKRITVTYSSVITQNYFLYKILKINILYLKS